MKTKGPIDVHDIFSITGRGIVFTTSKKQLPRGTVLNVGDKITVSTRSREVTRHVGYSEDGTYEIVGIETYRILTYPPIDGGSLGLVVKKVVIGDQ